MRKEVTRDAEHLQHALFDVLGQEHRSRLGKRCDSNNVFM
jgi:hypothetical protein